MRAMILLSWVALFGSPSVGHACSCFGPPTFCGTLDPPYPEPQWWIPDAVVLGVKVGAEAHGMDVRVLQVFAGNVEQDDTLRVWGDTGLLCRMYADSWAVGDTVVWGFRFTDQLGGAMEQPGDYLISICGTYWLEFENGMVSGPIDSEEPTSIPLEAFATLVDGCLTTGIGAVQAEQGLVAQFIDGAIRIQTTGVWAAAKELVITDARGRSLVSEQFTGDERAIPWQRGSPAVLVVLLSDGRRIVVQKVLVE